MKQLNVFTLATTVYYTGTRADNIIDWCTGELNSD